ncbi:MAG: hypothetical protein KDC11_03645 [Chitinophagaceae bacterium]|nr:hypothetical protein [Chitinophagaceae bacterium]
MKYLFSVLIVLFFAAPRAFAQPVKVEMKPLQDLYYIGDEKKLEKGVNCFVLQKRKEYEEFFGKTDRVDTPNFSKEWMLILVLPSTRKDVKMKFNRVSMKAGSFIEIYCDLGKLRGGTLTYEHHPLVACTIPQSDNTRLLKFYEEKKNGGLLMIDEVLLK